MGTKYEKGVGDGPAVSVIVTAYNEEQHIAEALESVLEQTFRDFEIVVIDDGSTDRTSEIVREYAQQERVPIRYLYQSNSGQPAARNRGIRNAQGSYVAFLDADDMWLPSKLKRQMQYLRSSPGLAWVYCDAYRFDSVTGRTRQLASQGQRLHKGDVLRPLLLGNFIVSVTPVVRRDVFEEVGYFQESSSVRGGGGEDWDMWLRIAARYPAGVVRAPLGKSRQDPQSMTGAMDLNHAMQGRMEIVRRTVRAHPERTADLRSRAVANVQANIGRRALDRENRRQARRLLGKALRRDPLNPFVWRYTLAAFLPRSVLRVLGRGRYYWKWMGRTDGAELENQGA
jgi:glycosyltransferase involved in cell wall biosynthesis